MTIETLLNGASRYQVASHKTNNPSCRFYVRSRQAGDKTDAQTVIAAANEIPAGAIELTELEAMERAAFIALERVAAPPVTVDAVDMARRYYEKTGRHMSDIHYADYQGIPW